MHSPAGTQFIIRDATKDDSVRVQAVVFSVLREFGLEPDPTGLDADLIDIEASYLAAGGIFKVADSSEGTIVATIGYVPVDALTCELRKMYLIPEVRGCGLGRLLLTQALERARAEGFRRMILDTHSALTAAARLYTGFGFVRVPCQHTSDRRDQSYLLNL